MQNAKDTLTDTAEGSNKKRAAALKLQLEKLNLVRQSPPHENGKGSSSCSSPVDLSTDLGSPLNTRAMVCRSPISSSAKTSKDVESHGIHSSPLSLKTENADEGSNTRVKGIDGGNLAEKINDHAANGRSEIMEGAQQRGQEYRSVPLAAKVAFQDRNSQAGEKLDSNGDSHSNGKNDGRTKEISRDFAEEAAASEDSYDSSMEDKERKKEDEKITDDLYFEQDVTRKQSFGSDSSSSSRGNLGMNENVLKNERLKHVKSVRADSARNGLVSSNQHTDIKESGIQGDAQSSVGSLRLKERKDAKVYPRDTRSAILESKMQQLEHRIKMLEGELREAAAIEASLYSIVAEHGSSGSKVHAPARRLSRLYLHACRESSQSRRAHVAKSAVSGLVLVAKACGNDVPRYRQMIKLFLGISFICSTICRCLYIFMSLASITRNIFFT